MHRKPSRTVNPLKDLQHLVDVILRSSFAPNSYRGIGDRLPKSYLEMLLAHLAECFSNETNRIPSVWRQINLAEPDLVCPRK